MNKVIVIGGSGYIGSVLITDLINKNYKVINIDRSIYGDTKSLDHINSKNFHNLKEDFANLKIINKLIDSGYNKIIFLAGLVGDPISKKYKKLSKKIMLKDTKKLIFFLEKKKILNFFYVSTCSNYGLDKSNKLLNEKSILKPLSIYASCKVEIEKFLIKRKINYTILRFSTAFGMSYRMRFDLTINQFVRDIYLNKKLVIFDSDTFRPYLHTKDFSRLFLILLKTRKKIKKEIFNVGSNKNNFSKKQILDKITKAKKSSKIFYKKHGFDRRNYKVDFSKIKKRLNFDAKYSVNFGIKEIINNLKEKKILRKKLNIFENKVIK